MNEKVNSTISNFTVVMTNNNNNNNSQEQQVNLANILDGKLEEFALNEGEDDGPVAQHAEGMCVECGDQPAVVYCEQCLDDYCEVCFSHQHRKGSRTKHKVKKLKGAQLYNPANENASAASAAIVSQQHQRTGSHGLGIKATILRAFKIPGEEPPPPAPADSDVVMDEDVDISAQEFIASQSGSLEASKRIGDSFVERAKYIPLRLTYEERKFLRLLEAGLNVSEYTDKIDVLSYSQVKSKRIVAQIKELCSILSGLVLAADYNVGQELFKDRDFERNKEFFQDIFELGRRHKIMNPEKMRATYGKLVYMLQDSQISEVQELLGFQCVKPICTVFTILQESQALHILNDPLIETATAEIIDEGKPRREVQAEIKKKERAIEYFAKKYGKRGADGPSPDTVRQCLYSIGDNNAFLRYVCYMCVSLYLYPTQRQSES